MVERVSSVGFTAGLFDFKIHNLALFQARTTERTTRAPAVAKPEVVQVKPSPEQASASRIEVCSLKNMKKFRQNPTFIGPRGDYHVGHQSCASKLAQDTGGWVGPSMLFSTPSPTQVIDHAFFYSGQAHVPSAVLFRQSVHAFSGHDNAVFPGEIL